MSFRNNRPKNANKFFSKTFDRTITPWRLRHCKVVRNAKFLGKSSTYFILEMRRSGGHCLRRYSESCRSVDNHTSCVLCGCFRTEVGRNSSGYHHFALSSIPRPNRPVRFRCSQTVASLFATFRKPQVQTDAVLHPSYCREAVNAISDEGFHIQRKD